MNDFASDVCVFAFYVELYTWSNPQSKFIQYPQQSWYVIPTPA